MNLSDDPLPTKITKVKDPLFLGRAWWWWWCWCSTAEGAQVKKTLKQRTLNSLKHFLPLSLIPWPLSLSLTCVCNVGQVIVLGGAGELFEFAVGEDERSAGRSLFQRLLHAPAGRYGRRQLCSIPSSHQTLNMTQILLFTTTISPPKPPSHPRPVQ